MSKVNTWANAIASRLGYTIIPKWRLPRREAANYMRQLFDWLEIGVVLDVGANRGQYRDYIRAEVGFRGKVISWEPIPELAQFLQLRAREDPDWHVEAAALGRAAGKARFKVMTNSEFSSLHAPTAEALARFQQQTESHEVEIEVRTLEREFERLRDWIGDGQRIYLKLDTQGNDLAVLEGARSCLRLVDALQSEVAVRPIYQGVPDLPESLSRIRALGFEPSGVFPNNDGHFPWLLELDMHFVAARHMPAPAAASR